MKKFEMIDYSGFRINKLNLPQYRHLKYLVFWPLYGLAFLFVERIWIRSSYYPMHCSWDDAIPFCEYFLIPYLLWFLLLIGAHIYTLLFDRQAFIRLMRFIIITYSAALIVYLLFPNCQQLRPAAFERHNALTSIMGAFYKLDTNTNVCPSIHVIGSFAVLFAAWHSRHFSSAPWRAAFIVITVLVSASTVFLKQHSILDVMAALPICAIAYPIAYNTKIDFRENPVYAQIN